MRDRYVIDTNVLIAASAADPINPSAIDATPDDPEVRKKVWDWLDQFSSSDSRLVLDLNSKIYEEYCNKLDFGHFGIQVIMDKWSTACVDLAEVEYDIDDHGVLEEPLNTVVHDNADKKMVAASLDARDRFGSSCIAFAGDTDWHDWESALIEAFLDLEPIIEKWSRLKHAEKSS